MDHAVAGGEICRDNFGAIDRHAHLVGLQCELLAVYRRRFTGLYIGRHDLGGNDVIGKNRDELGLVFGQEQRLHGARGQFAKGGVGQRENRKRSGAAQGFNEPGGLHSGDERSIIYTGLRRTELNGLKWDDFNFTTDPPQLKVPSSISKNRKESTHYLRPELLAAIQAAKPKWAKPETFVFRGQIPRVQTMQKDLAAAEIPFEDARGRRVDLHALRKTYGTLLAASGVSPRVAMELMRHSDMKLTMGVYTDVTQLPIVQETSRLPSFQFAAKAGRRVGNQSLKTAVALTK